MQAEIGQSDGGWHDRARETKLAHLGVAVDWVGLGWTVDSYRRELRQGNDEHRQRRRNPGACRQCDAISAKMSPLTRRIRE